MIRGASPFAPNTVEDTEAMLAAVGVETVDDLFDIPTDVRFTGSFGIPARTEQEIRQELEHTLHWNEDLTEFLGRGHYGHYVPSLVDSLSLRSEFLTSYTQYQAEIAQGFLQALFEYQSMLVELTGLPIANSSMYDAASALGEAALLSARVRETTGNRVLIPETLRSSYQSTLRNYVHGSGMTVDTYAMDDGNVDLEDLTSVIDDDVVLVHVENPTIRGTIEEGIAAVAALAHDHDALCSLDSDPIALSVLSVPADDGVDVVVGDASVLGLGTSYGMGLGMFATRERFLRQVPGRLVGVSKDATNRRAYTLTLQTREQHIRRERATSNICTNQAWVALRTAIHAASLGPDGLVSLASDLVRDADGLASRLDEIIGVKAPVHDRHHFREFVAHTDQPAQVIANDLEDRGFAVHVVGEHEIQVCVTELNEHAVDDFVLAFEEVAH